MLVFIFVVVALIGLIIFLRRKLAKRFILDCFRDGNTLVCGLRGRGKDMLFNWVVNKRKRSYISNCDYGGNTDYENVTEKSFTRIPVELQEQFSVGGNTCENFIENAVIPYDYPYPDGVDYYISDAGIYFPSHLDSYLNRRYKSVPVFQALSRQLGGCNVHCNVQNINRLWLKIREQFDCYIQCMDCRVRFGKFVRIKMFVYDKYQSCVDRVKPMKRRFGKKSKIEFEKFTGAYGTIKKVVIHFRIPHIYDDRIFKTMLKSNKGEC